MKRGYILIIAVISAMYLASCGQKNAQTQGNEGVEQNINIKEDGEAIEESEEATKEEIIEEITVKEYLDTLSFDKPTFVVIDMEVK